MDDFFWRDNRNITVNGAWIPFGCFSTRQVLFAQSQNVSLWKSIKFHVHRTWILRSLLKWYKSIGFNTSICSYLFPQPQHLQCYLAWLSWLLNIHFTGVFFVCLMFYLWHLVNIRFTGFLGQQLLRSLHGITKQLVCQLFLQRHFKMKIPIFWSTASIKKVTLRLGI